MHEQANAMPQVARPAAHRRRGQPLTHLLIDVTATHAWAGPSFDHRQCLADVPPSRQLFIRRPSIDGDRPGVVAEVAAIGRPQVEDVEFASIAWACSGWPATNTARIVVAGASEHLAARFHGRRLQRGKDLQLRNPRPDPLPRRLVHRPGRGDRPAKQHEFVGVFPPPERQEVEIDIEHLGTRQQPRDMRRADGELHPHAGLAAPRRQPVAEHRRRGLTLIGAKRGATLRDIGPHLGGSRLLKLQWLVGADQQGLASQQHRHRGGKPEIPAVPGEILHMLRRHEDDSIERPFGHAAAEPCLADTAGVEVEQGRESVHGMGSRVHHGSARGV